ncbi:hypothetical protein LTR65_004614 [Meristemomyces frigidus]
MPTYTSLWHINPVPYPHQEQHQATATYAQVLRTPPPAPRPEHPSLAPAQWPSLHQAVSTESAVAHPKSVPAAQQPSVSPTQGPYSYAHAAYQALGKRSYSTRQAQTHTASPASGIAQHYGPAQCAYMTPPHSAQLTAESYTQAQQRGDQGFPYQSPTQPRTPSSQQRYASTAIPTDFYGSQVSQNPTNVAMWNRQPRAALDRTTAITAYPAWVADPPIAPPISASQHSSGQKFLWRTRAQLRDSTDSSNQCRCDLCKQHYPTMTDLRKHIQRYHADIASRPKPCRVDGCPWRFSFPREVDRHMSSLHPDQLPEVARHYCRYDGCAYSERGFPRKDNRDRHERVHREGDSQPMSRSSSSQTFQS